MKCVGFRSSERRLGFMAGYISVFFLLFFAAVMVLIYPAQASEGISEGLRLCLENLIPSLYPFMVISNVFVEADLISGENRLVTYIMKKLFALPGKCAAVIFFSFLGGFPVGVKMTHCLFNKGVITEKQGRQLMLFCVNPGPAFVISYVGSSLYGSEKIGFLLYCSVIISSLITGVFSRFLFEGDYNEAVPEKKKPTALTVAFQKSVHNTLQSIMEISAWVLVFSCILSILEKLRLSYGIQLMAESLLEVTSGCRNGADTLSLPSLAGIISFGGLCVHLQLWSSLNAVGLSYKLFLASRIISAGISIVVCRLLMGIFVIDVETIAIGVRPETVSNSASAIVSILTVIMSVLFLIGDNYIIQRKVKN